MTLPLSTIISVNVFFPPVGLPTFNVNNLGLFTSDPFLSNPNNDNFRIYQSADAVGLDFGTTTETYQQALAVFSQLPNPLAGGGSLIIFPSFSNSSIGTVAINAAGTGYKQGDILSIVQGNAYGGSVTVNSVYAGAVTSITVNSIGAGYSTGTGLATTGVTTGTGFTINISTLTTETLAQAVARTSNMIYYCGIISTNYGANTTWQALATTVQAYGNKLLFLPSNALTDIAGAFTTIQQATLYFARCLFYSTSGLTARLFAASYAARLLSVNFTGSLTAITMNLKQLQGVVPDPIMTPTLLNLCNTAGVDVYSSYQNSPATISTGGNKFADQAFNIIWFVLGLQVAGYNCLAQTVTKIPQTTQGMNQYVGSLKQVCQQGVNNGYIAPGEWNSPTTFGNQDDFFNNIRSYGFYIYYTPVALQLPADRQARKAPLVQIAIKESGAIQSSIINVYDNP